LSGVNFYLRIMKRIIYLLLLMFFVNIGMTGQQPAFPGAEGGGMYTTGGRGGYVYFVNSLADTNTGDAATNSGTLRWCLSSSRSGPRTIVFKVAGIIELTSSLNVLSNTTIAGQTAPGNGICIKNKAITVTSAALTAVTTYSAPTFTINGSNIIIRTI
jgi:hypothetical protein